jgi:quercetin dioxygenase-like cupin family protein
MIWRIGIPLTCIFVLASGAVASAQDADETGATTPTFVSAVDLDWTDLDPEGAPGVQIADLWGDHRQGSFGALFRLPAGFATPLHTHSHDMRLVILSGTYLQTPEGRSEIRAIPGSYLMQPGGEYRHTTSCDAAADCLFFVESDGAFDFRPVASGTSPAE